MKDIRELVEHILNLTRENIFVSTTIKIILRVRSNWISMNQYIKIFHQEKELHVRRFFVVGKKKNKYWNYGQFSGEMSSNDTRWNVISMHNEDLELDGDSTSQIWIRYLMYPTEDKSDIWSNQEKYIWRDVR